MERNKERSGDIKVKVIKWTQNEIGREPRIGSHEPNEIMRPIHFPLSKNCYSKEQNEYNATRFQCPNGFWTRADDKNQYWSCQKTEDGRCTFGKCPMLKSRQS